MCPFSLGHAYLTPAGGPVHAMSDFADPTFDHVSNNTHVNDDSILEIILDSIQINSIVALPVAALHRLKPANAYVSGVHDQHFTCQRTQTTLVAGGSAMVQRSASTSRGLMASPVGIFTDLIMGNDAVMNHQKCDWARRSLRAQSRNTACFQGIYGYLPVPGLLPPPAPPLPGPLGLSPLLPGASFASPPAEVAASACARNFNRSGWS